MKTVTIFYKNYSKDQSDVIRMKSKLRQYRLFRPDSLPMAIQGIKIENWNKVKYLLSMLAKYLKLERHLKPL